MFSKFSMLCCLKTTKCNLFLTNKEIINLFWEKLIASLTHHRGGHFAIACADGKVGPSLHRGPRPNFCRTLLHNALC